MEPRDNLPQFGRRCWPETDRPRRRPGPRGLVHDSDGEDWLLRVVREQHLAPEVDEASPSRSWWLGLLFHAVHVVRRVCIGLARVVVAGGRRCRRSRAQ